MVPVREVILDKHDEWYLNTTIECKCSIYSKMIVALRYILDNHIKDKFLSSVNLLNRIIKLKWHNRKCMIYENESMVVYLYKFLPEENNKLEYFNNS